MQRMAAEQEAARASASAERDARAEAARPEPSEPIKAKVETAKPGELSTPAKAPEPTAETLASGTLVDIQA